MPEVKTLTETTMSLLSMNQFISCFRKQFQFQAGKGGLRRGRYYTAYNKEKGLKTDCWAMLVFIKTAIEYGFEEEEIIKELQIRPSLFHELYESLPIHLAENCPDKNLHQVIVVKIGLVKNAILFAYGIKANINPHGTEW